MKITWYRQGQGDRQPYKVSPITCVEDVVEVSDFLFEGYGQLREGLKLTWDEFLSELLRVAKAGLTTAITAVFFSKSGKPLGYIILMDETLGSVERVAHIYAAYSNGLYRGIADEAIRFAEEWAKQNGFNKLQATSRRMSGAAMKLFKKRLKFRPVYVVFEKGLNE